MENYFQLFKEVSKKSAPTKLDHAEDIYLELLEVVACSLDSYDQDKAKEMLLAYFYQIYLYGNKNEDELLFINRFCFLQKKNQDLFEYLSLCYEENYNIFENYLRYYSSYDARQKLILVAIYIIDAGKRESISQELDEYLTSISTK